MPELRSAFVRLPRRLFRLTQGRLHPQPAEDGARIVAPLRAVTSRLSHHPPSARVMVPCQSNGAGEGNRSLPLVLRAFPTLATARDRPVRVGEVKFLPPQTRS